MKSYQQPPSAQSKKTERKVGKGKGKETRLGSCQNPLRPRACACAHEVKAEGEGERRRVSRYQIAGAAADELIGILGGCPSRDRGTWAYYCYHHDVGILMDKAHELASKKRQCEIRNPVTAFQRWLIRNFGREA